MIREKKNRIECHKSQYRDEYHGVDVNSLLKLSISLYHINFLKEPAFTVLTFHSLFNMLEPGFCFTMPQS